ncbi:MAG: sodium/solute symporter [Planctomycetaceae bacterium]
MTTLRFVDLLVIGLYFASLVVVGWFFSRRVKTTEDYFVGKRSYPGWVAGISLFGAQISSITFVAYPADAFKTAWLRYLICLVLPVSVFIATRYFLPFFRRGNVTSLFEYLEARFGPKTRVYGASVFIIAQCIRISMIQYLVALLMHTMTGWSVPVCLLLGGAVTAYYTIVGGLEAVIWTDVVQAIILTGGGLLILGTVIWKLPGGVGEVFSTAIANGKLLFAEAGADGTFQAIPWGFSLTRKTVVMILAVGVIQWLTDYVTNQEVVQRYCAARSERDASRAMWICCWSCLPTWAYFMFIGTALYVFYQKFPDPLAAEMLNGTRKAEGIVPLFVTSQLGPGFTGLVIAAVLAAAMSSMSSALNSISAVAITDIYRRHLAPGRDQSEYVRAAKLVTLASSIVMIGGAWWLLHADTTTLQHLWTEFQSILAGGLLGLFLLGFLTTRVDGRAVGVGVACAVAFSALISLVSLGLLPASWAEAVNSRFDSYYTSIVGNLLTFIVGYSVARLLNSPPRDLKNLTLWTSSAPEDPPSGLH